MVKKIFCLILCLSLLSCQSTQEDEAVEISTPNREVEQGLVLSNATLEQSNPEGETLWKLGTEKAVYTQDKKIAKLTNVTGNLFSKNEVILQVSAKKGEIKQDGEKIYLQEDIIAVDPRNKAELKANELEWTPKENKLIIRNKVTGNHAKLTISANEGIYNTQKQRLELKGNIVATTNKPPLQMKTEHLFWLVPEDRIIGDRPLKMTRYKEKTITDQVTTNQAEVNLKTNLATIKGNIEYKSLEPPLQAATNVIFWQYENRIIDSKEPIKLIQTEDNMTLTGNEANVNLNENMAYLYKGVYGEAAKNEVKIFSDHIAWNIKTKEMEATGNVNYQQINPDFNLSGVKAVGRLQDKSVTVTGDYQNKVVTKIYPE